jgi:hypothetical protein
MDLGNTPQGVRILNLATVSMRLGNLGTVQIGVEQSPKTTRDQTLAFVRADLMDFYNIRIMVKNYYVYYKIC